MVVCLGRRGLLRDGLGPAPGDERRKGKGLNSALQQRVSGEAGPRLRQTIIAGGGARALGKLEVVVVACSSGACSLPRLVLREPRLAVGTPTEPSARVGLALSRGAEFAGEAWLRRLLANAGRSAVRAQS